MSVSSVLTVGDTLVNPKGKESPGLWNLNIAKNNERISACYQVLSTVFEVEEKKDRE